MELRQVRYFLVVADQLHFGQAAKLLHLTQPPLTVAVKGLERELGVQLFHRTTRRVTLTAAGQAFRDRIRVAIAELDDAAGDVADIAAGKSGKIRVGFVSSASYTTVPEAIQAFRQQRPRIDLVLNPLTSGEQIEQLLDGHLDLGLIRDPGDVPGLNLELLSSEDLVAVLPETHHLAAAEEIRPQDLEGEPMILFPYRLMPGFVARVLRLFEPLATPRQWYSMPFIRKRSWDSSPQGWGFPSCRSRCSDSRCRESPRAALSAGRRRSSTLRAPLAIHLPWRTSSGASRERFPDNTRQENGPER
jgi:DNA-binding transcriptional LysR family regulator